jgi:hypothetical protein
MMMNFEQLAREAEHLSNAERWRLVKHLLRLLEYETMVPSPTLDWQTFLSETYGSMRDAPIQRWSQGEYEEREPLE